MSVCYTEKYTEDYQVVPGTTVLSSSDTIYQNVYSADVCARLCSNYNGFNCKSFDYCDGISTCYLGKTHFYDVPQTDLMDAPMCNHYSRKYFGIEFQNDKSNHGYAAKVQSNKKPMCCNVSDEMVQLSTTWNPTLQRCPDMYLRKFFFVKKRNGCFCLDLHDIVSFCNLNES